MNKNNYVYIKINLTDSRGRKERLKELIIDKFSNIMNIAMMIAVVLITMLYVFIFHSVFDYLEEDFYNYME